MELVIKLDDETYKEVMERTEFDTLSLGVKLIEAVQNGTPLREEMEKLRTDIHLLCVTGITGKTLVSIKNVDEMIDNHIKENKQ